jgi:ATP-dependent Clp protease ATP-binding subunit ClpA
MFERYTEKARRTIFYARYEASQFGSSYIETEHLLLGLLREDHAIAHRFLGENAAEEMRKKITAQTPVREAVSTSVDMPLSNECKRVLAYAAEEAERLSHQHIGSEHLFLGLLREEKSFAAALLNERGVKLEDARLHIKQTGTQVLAESRSGETIHVAPPEIVFVCGEQQIGRVFNVVPLPRMPQLGESVVLGGRTYRVEDIVSTFQTAREGHQDCYLARVVIRLKES